MKKLTLYRTISSIVLVAMLVFICTYIYSTEEQYVFTYANEDVIYNGKKTNNRISLMFNVYWGEEYIEDILSVLNKYNISTTFFVGGTWVEKNLDTLLKICMAGHEIGNHGYFHRDHDKLDFDGNMDEISATHNLVKSYLSIDMRLFAPPSGYFNNSTIKACCDLGYNVIMWTRDTIDWRDQDINLIYNRAISNASSGDLILMHPTKSTLDSLPMIITYLQANGFILTTVTDNIFN